MLSINAHNLAFHIAEDATDAYFTAEGASGVRGSDFWRLILDDGLRTEIPVFSSKQQGAAAMCGDKLIISYDKVVSEYGDTYEVKLTVTVWEQDGHLYFVPELENGSDARVNECFCPLADFDSLGGEKKEDIFYIPNGLGQRAYNPWQVMANMTTNYYYHNEFEIFWHQHYPRATMGWFGIQSGNHFLYVGRHDTEHRHCFLTMRQRIHAKPTNLMLGIDHFPMARPGEKLLMPPTVLAFLDGDWRKGADLYRDYAEKTFYRVPEKAEWVKYMSGWQRLIMRSQYGEDYFTADDLPELYKIGAKYGIHTLFLFAWWKQGMDRNYPIYEEPYEGAWKDLTENIKKVQELGGRVILECNCHFMDPQVDYYKEHGEYIRMLNINGDEIRPAFVYPGYGEVRATYGAKQFALCCSATKMWRDQVLSQIKLMDELGADCTFADCYAGCPYQPCFNDKHEHGNRVDEDWKYHKMFFEEAEAYCRSKGKVLAAEVVTDVAAPYNQFIHGLVNVDFKIKGDQFPEMFRYTFPEVITTERGIRDEEGDFARRLRCSLVYGLRLDAELYVCRPHLDSAPLYAAAVKEYTDTMMKYKEFMYDGTFTVINAEPLPRYVRRGEYISADGKKVLCITYNPLDHEVPIGDKTLGADEMTFEIFDRETYCK